MSPEAEDIIRQVMALPEDMRWDVIDRLVVAAHEAGHEADFAPGVAAEWDAEIARRLREIDEGKVKMIPADQVMREIDDLLDGGGRDAAD